MEQAPYWMLRKRSVHEYLDDSWEEKAFAEDAAGMLGGCVWPPRSYSCSFCKREFRSAQALGGHMNVHRRDRARLKQFSAIPNDQKIDPHQHSTYFCDDLITSRPSLTLTYPTTQDYPLVRGNPNPNSHHHPTVVSIPQKMSTPVSQEKNVSNQILSPHITSRFVLQKKYPSFTSLDDEIGSKNKDLGCKYEKHHERSSLSISLVSKQNYPTTAASDHHEDAPSLSKKRKLEESPQSVIPTISGVRTTVDVEASKVDHGHKSSSLEELDLELRLGSQTV